MAGSVVVALRTASALFVLQTTRPQTRSPGAVVRAQRFLWALSAAALSPAKIVWLGTENKATAVE